MGVGVEGAEILDCALGNAELEGMLALGEAMSVLAAARERVELSMSARAPGRGLKVRAL